MQNHNTSSSTPTLCINTALTNITHATTGATHDGVANYICIMGDVITIHTICPGTFNYTIPLSGGCGSRQMTADNTAGVASSTPTLCINTALLSRMLPQAQLELAMTVAGANGLPGGVSASWSGDVITISGTPSASGTFNYTIPLSPLVRSQH